MQKLTASTLLTVWERGRVRHPIDRSLLLFALATPETEPNNLADQPLGRRNLALLKLRQVTFGRYLRAYLDCPSCGERLELNLDVSDLLASAADSPDSGKTIQVNEWRFRLPTSRDLAMIAQETDVKATAMTLLGLCLLNDASAEPSLASCMDQVEAAMDEADPLADLALDFQCNACGHTGTAPFDIGVFLWEEIEARAQRLLDEVYLLSRAYCWREADILALTETRRAAYLERVTT